MNVPAVPPDGLQSQAGFVYDSNGCEENMWQWEEGIPEIFKNSMTFLGRDQETIP